MISRQEALSGYTKKLYFNKNWKRQKGVICGWEHCIEMMPLPKKEIAGSCPEFGHVCPGGVKQVKICKKSGI